MRAQDTYSKIYPHQFAVQIVLFSLDIGYLRTLVKKKSKNLKRPGFGEGKRFSLYNSMGKMTKILRNMSFLG